VSGQLYGANNSESSQRILIFKPLLLQGVTASESQFMHCWLPEAVAFEFQVFWIFVFVNLSNEPFILFGGVAIWLGFFPVVARVVGEAELPGHHQVQRAEGSLDLD
jgi:hypothetical protein